MCEHIAGAGLCSGGKRTETSTLDRMPKRLQAKHYNDKDIDQDTNLQRADVIDDMHLDFVERKWHRCGKERSECELCAG